MLARKDDRKRLLLLQFSLFMLRSHHILLHVFNELTDVLRQAEIEAWVYDQSVESQNPRQSISRLQLGPEGISRLA